MDINTLVEDIYTLMETKEIPDGIDLDAECERFGRLMADSLRDSFTQYDGVGRLRLSAVGKPDRKIYNAYHGVEGEQLRGATHIKFLYGHLVEAMVLALARISGHSVTDEQKRVEVEGVAGHIDCRIDDVLIDVKSSSSFGFKKFRYNELHKDDAFGYIGQLKAYAHAEGDQQYGWLAMDKQNGTLALLVYDETDTTTDYYDDVNYDISQRIRDIKKIVGSSIVPSVCYEPIPDGKSGNMKLDTGCAYCDYKFHCWPNVQTFLYSQGPRYLTHVAKEPRVAELPDDF